jgi:hemin uptake protein HemP
MTHDTPNLGTAAAEAAPGTAVPGTAARAPAPSGTLKITSEKLFAGALEVQIDHHGALYRLKKTSLGKLILTK